LRAITKRLKRGERGISTVIVVMLSLVLVVIIVGNVVLWNYQMNQLDIDRMQETVALTNVTHITRSSWAFAQNEYSVSTGTRLDGTYADTTASDGLCETFREETQGSLYRLNISNDFAIDLSTYPCDYVYGIEIAVRYNVTEYTEKWFLKAYNWAASSFSDAGFNITAGNQPADGEWNEYAIAVTGNWADYVNDEGVVRIEFFDEGLSANQTVVSVDFFGARAIMDVSRLDIKNSSPLTIHIVAIWVTDSTVHQRYNIDLFLNSGESVEYISRDISLPQNAFIAKVITERGNTAVFSND
jgi:hypothetical protein